MKLSIVVPVYKVEQYLDRCVKSILAQTFTDFELILVDDGSPDSCGQMCEDWGKKDERIRVVHKENGGLSDARNAGIDVARGDYIGLIDSDDYIKTDMFEVLITNLEQYNADISMCGYVDVYADRTQNECLDRTVYVWSQEEAIYQILLGKMLSVHAVVKLYKRSLFDNVRYTKGIISEDAYIIMDIMDQVKIAVFTPYSAYYYFHRENSINTSRFRDVDMTRIEGHLRNYNYIKEKFPQLERLAYDRYLGAVGFVAHKIAMTPDIVLDEEKKSVIRILRKNLFKIYTSEYFNNKRRLGFTTLVFSRSMYRKVVQKLYRYS